MSYDQYQILDKMEQAVLEAARYQIAMLTSGSDLAVERKADQTLVTVLDIDSQRLLSKKLSGMCSIVGEEDEKSHDLIISSERYFVIDPLDGTTACKRFTTARGGQVGFGPLVGFVESGKLQSACFFNLPARTLTSAIRGLGCYQILFKEGQNLSDLLPQLSTRKKLSVEKAGELSDGAILFHSFTGEELPLVSIMMKNKVVETAYRFGGFANDCQRLAQGLEQVQIQYTVKAWDFSATLFEVEAGLQVICDPINNPTPFEDWKVKPMNPVIAAHPGLMPEVQLWLERAKTAGAERTNN